jgi:HD-GYP domain-containing protein (c-di-GMP phosphodiesterase class II)
MYQAILENDQEYFKNNMEEIKSLFPWNQREKLYKAALLHDIGKIGTYEHVLNKIGKLTNKEFSLIKKHKVKI